MDAVYTLLSIHIQVYVICFTYNEKLYRNINIISLNSFGNTVFTPDFIFM